MAVLLPTGVERSPFAVEIERNAVLAFVLVVESLESVLVD